MGISLLVDAFQVYHRLIFLSSFVSRQGAMILQVLYYHSRVLIQASNRAASSKRALLY